MTQEEKDILLKDLCARLPYEVKCKTIDEENIEIDHSLTGIIIEAFKEGIITDIKPYLRPISSMTEEEMDKLFDILHIDKEGKDEDWIKINDVLGIKFFFPTGKWIENVAEAYDFLYSIHIDFRGLIHKDLAIKVTNENNPYS